VQIDTGSVGTIHFYDKVITGTLYVNALDRLPSCRTCL